MKKLVVVAALLFAGIAMAQTEDELVKYTTASLELVRAGKLSELDHYRDIYKVRTTKSELDIG